MTHPDVYCPDCGARAGRPCETRRRTERLRPHRARLAEVERREAQRAEQVELRSTLRALTDGEFDALVADARNRGADLIAGTGERMFLTVLRLARRLAATDDRRGEP